MGAELDINAIAKAYARWAPIYDLVFGAVFDRGAQGIDRGRRAHRRAHPRSRRRHRDLAARLFLDATRSSASIIPSRCCARRSSAWPSIALDNVEVLAVMDAQQLGFPDHFFDVVVAQYVITAVPDPEATLDEFVRVVRARRRDHPGQSSRRRDRAAPRVRAVALRRWRGGSAGGRNSAGIAWRNGRRTMAACRCSNVAPCRHSGISR